MTRDPARIALSILALVAIAAYAFVFRPMESTLADRYAQADALRSGLERHMAIARRMPAIAAERSALERYMRPFRLHDSSAVLVDRFLHATARIAAADAIAIETITAQGAAPAFTPGNVVPKPRDQSADPFDRIHLDLTMRGPYSNVLHAIRTLNDTGIAMQLTVATLSTTGRRAGARPQLNATFHLSLLREADAVVHHVPYSV
jgi:Tfp pilus assembly protein PilO